MATSADHDDRDEKDEKDEAPEGEESADEKDDEPEEAAEKARAKKAGAKEKPSVKGKASAKAEAAEDEEEEEEEGDEEEEEEEEKPAPKAKPAAKRPGSRGPGAARARKGPVQPGGSLGKSVLLFFVIVIGLGVGFAYFGRGEQAPAARPKWKTGDVADVEITLVSTDKTDLACSSTEEIGGKHCAFEAPLKPWTKGPSADDKVVLKPYATTDQINFVAAGVWSDPALGPGKLPAARFSTKCKLKIEGTLKNLNVRWREGEGWGEQHEWYAGSISNCKLN